MGWLDWLMPSPEKRIARARRLLEHNDPAEARLEVDGLDHPEAAEVLAEAHRQLVRINLDAAVSWSEAGDDERVRWHLELAEQFGGRDDRDAFREARRAIREQRQARAAAASEAGDALEDLTAPVEEERRARLALTWEGYPDALRPAAATLGPDFAEAVLDLDEGRPHDALPRLLSLSDEQPLVRWERARAAMALNDLPAVVRELEAFGRLAGGHHPIGNQHTGLELSAALARTRGPATALPLMRDLRTRRPKLGGLLYAQLLVAVEEDAEAEAVLRQLVRDHPTDPSPYKLLASLRERAGHRVEAMRALEASLEAVACRTGSCSYRPPDPEVKLHLARLYLEDGLETQRAFELLEGLPAPREPGFAWAWVHALADQARGVPGADQRVADLDAARGATSGASATGTAASAAS